MVGCEPLRVGVVGVGYLGAHHARIYASLPGVELVGVVDLQPDRAREVAAQWGTRAFSRWQDLVGEIQAASVAVPTVVHAEVAGGLLEAGVDVLVEKPIAATLEAAQTLVQTARDRNRVLQVGHSERFNGGVEALAALLDRPGFLEIHRIGPYSGRGIDVDVVLDLMIHDLDLLRYLLRRSVREIRAVGVSVLTGHLDIANARLEFEDGCVANVTASRVSQGRMRKIRVFQPDAYLSLDTDQRRLEAFRRIRQNGKTEIRQEVVPVAWKEPLRAEIEDFVEAVRTRKTPLVSGEEGLETLRLALAVQEAAARHWRRRG